MDLTEPLTPPSPARPPLWPSLLAPFLALVCTMFATSSVLTLLALLDHPDLLQGDVKQNIKLWLDENVASFPTIVAVLAPGQICFLGVAIFLAVVERKRVLPYLGLVRWRVSGSTVALAVVGSLGVQFLIDLAAEALIDEPSEQLRMLARMFQEPRGLAAIGVGILISVGPAICEEALFRGVTQRGLLRRWSPGAAIGVTSVLFAAAHWDLQHSAAVLPLGVWFGWVAWRTGSVWPAMMCHFANNLVAFVVVRFWTDSESLDMPRVPASYAVGVALVAVAIVAAVRLARTPPIQR